MSINERIKNRRIALDMSQDELANKIGYAGRDSVSRIESGKHSVPQSKLVAIANALNCSVNYLLGIDENENQISQDYNLNLSVAQKQLISMMDNMSSSEQIKLLRIAEIVFDNENKK